MREVTGRTSRTAERFLLDPALPALFGGEPVHVCDISLGGARVRSDKVIASGTKTALRAAATDRVTPLTVECVVVWCQPDSGDPGKFVSGIRVLAAAEVMGALLAQLHKTHRTRRIEELRAVDRYVIRPSIEAEFGGRSATIVDISTRGARIEVSQKPRAGAVAEISFSAAAAADQFSANARVVWTSLRAVGRDGAQVWHAGLFIDGKADELRMAIARLSAQKRATLETTSLHLKLRILRAKARKLSPFTGLGTDIDPEQDLLIRSVREELRLNPDEALYWYRRARLVIADPGTKQVAPQIADHPEAVAVWEYLDRTIDPTIVCRAFGLQPE